jgi:lipopolysaccharide export system permease protein
MKTFDRYLLRLFVKVLLVCLISITGLYVVIDACNNLDEFLGYGKRYGFLKVLGQYYSARIPWFFDRISGLLALIAAMFAVTWLQRTNEMTALMAAGIPKSRILKPLIAAALLVSLLAAANRELLIPSFRPRLLRNAQDWLGDMPQRLEPQRDYRTDILLSGYATYAKDQRIEQPNFRLQQPIGDFGRKLLAANAYYQPSRDGRPAGYLLDEVIEPDNLMEIPSAELDQHLIVLSPRDTPWLEADQCFVVSEVGFEQLAGGAQWRQLASTSELLRGLRNPSLDFGLDARVTVHARLVQPILDMALFFLGIPLVLTRESRNIFTAAGSCLLVVIGFFLVVMTCQALGSNGYLLAPALAAWVPLMIFVPLATAAASPIWD